MSDAICWWWCSCRDKHRLLRFYQNKRQNRKCLLNADFIEKRNYSPTLRNGKATDPLGAMVLLEDNPFGNYYVNVFLKNQCAKSQNTPRTHQRWDGSDTSPGSAGAYRSSSILQHNPRSLRLQTLLATTSWGCIRTHLRACEVFNSPFQQLDSFLAPPATLQEYPATFLCFFHNRHALVK